jgi:E3 ubiquitin-protein transferase RMND5
MMLRCGHVICRHSMVRLLKGGNRLKCPTCPQETEASQALQLHL